MIHRFYLQNAASIIVLLSFALLVIIAIKPLNHDELWFIHHAWEFNNKNLSDIDFRSGYPLIFTATFLSYFFEVFSLQSLIFLKPLLSLIYLSLLLKHFKDKKNISILSLFFLMLLNRAVEIRPESVCTILLLLLTSFNFDLKNKSAYVKLTLLMFVPFISARFAVVAAFIYLQTLLISKEKASILHLIIPFGIFFIVYSTLIELPWDTISHLFSMADMRDPQGIVYKLNRIFGNSITYKLISCAVLINMLNNIFGYRKKLDILFLLGLITNILYLIVLDKVPYEYAFLPTAVYIFWYLNQGDTRLPSLSKIPLLKELTVILIIGFFLSDLNKNRDHYKKFINYYVSSKNINLIEDDLLNPNLFSYKQIENRKLICEKYQGYFAYSHRFNFHPICLSDKYYIRSVRELMSEEKISEKISNYKTVKIISTGQNSVFFYK